MKQFNAISLLMIATLSGKVFSLELADYSYICFSHDAVFSDKSAMIQTLKCVNTIGREHIEQLTYNDDGTWSAILYSYDAEMPVFGKTSDLRTSR